MRVLLVSSSLLLAACSSSESSSAAPDSAVDANHGDACTTPVEGAACAKSEMLCPGNEGGCCAGYVWSCVDGAWQKSGVGCACMEDAGSETHDATGDVASDAGPFACGSATCDANQICKVQAPGIDGGTESRACEGVPSACASTPTCDCIKTKLPGCTANACTTDAQGHVTVSCMGI